MLYCTINYPEQTYTNVGASFKSRFGMDEPTTHTPDNKLWIKKCEPHTCAHVDVRRGGGRREDMSENRGDGWGEHLRGGCKHSKSIKIQLLQAKPGFITNQSGARQGFHASISSPEK